MDLQELKNKADMIWHIDQYEEMIGQSNSFYIASREFVRAINRMKYLVLASRRFDNDKYSYYYNCLVFLFEANNYKAWGQEVDHKRTIANKTKFRKQYKDYLRGITSPEMD